MNMQLEVERKKIDEIDERIAALVSERLNLAKRIGSLKRRAGPLQGAGREGGDGVLVPGREQGILDRLAAKHPSLPREALEGIFREIFAAARAAQAPPGVEP